MTWLPDSVHRLFDCIPLYARNWVAFFLLGVINNLAYVVINSSAQDLVEKFNTENLIGLVLWCNIFFGFFARLANTFFLLDWSYASRIWITSGLFFFGIIGVAFSVYVNFWFALSCIVLIGTASSFGESVLLGFLKGYESELVGGWSSGTGMAGVAGSALYLLFKTLKFSLRNRFLYMLPSIFIYVISFFVFVSAPTKTPEREVNSDPVPSETAKDDANSEDRGLITGDGKTETTTQLYWRCWKLCWWRTVNLALVYFLEYVVTTGCAAKLNLDAKTSHHWAVKNAYVILSFCYQFGVLISRSSLAVVRISAIEVITVLQALNFVLWELAAYYQFLPTSAQFPLMVYVGLLGGASYVNIFYLLLNDNTMTSRDREICINIAAAAVVIGISAAAAFTLLMDNTWLKDVGHLPAPETLSPNATALVW